MALNNEFTFFQLSDFFGIDETFITDDANDLTFLSLKFHMQKKIIWKFRNIHQHILEIDSMAFMRKLTIIGVTLGSD